MADIPNEEQKLKEELEKKQKEKRKQFWLVKLPSIFVYLFCFLLFPAFIIFMLPASCLFF